MNNSNQALAGNIRVPSLTSGQPYNGHIGGFTPQDLGNHARATPCPSCGVCPTCGRAPHVYQDPRNYFYGSSFTNPDRRDETQIPSDEIMEKIKKFIADREKEMAQQKLAKGLR